MAATQMQVDSWELYMISTEWVTIDMIIWKRYRNRAKGMVELMLDANPQLSWVHRTTPFIPVGVYVRVPVINALVLGKQPLLPQSSLWTDKAGYTL